MTTLKVDINDKLNKILEIMATDNKSGYLVSNGKIILQEKLDSTFAKSYILSGDTFALVCSSNTSLREARKWVRFPTTMSTDYYCLSTHSWDSVAFVPRTSVFFIGFGAMSNSEKKDIKLKIMWDIGGEKSEEYEIDLHEADKD